MIDHCAAERFLVAAVFLVAGAPLAEAVDRVTFVRDGQSRSVVGEVQVEAQDGGLLLLADDGRLWTIQPDELEQRETDDAPLQPLSSGEVAERLLAEMPPGFEVYQTAHYVICHNTSESYVRWAGSLFEQLYRGYYAYWKNRGWQLPEPRFPLVALVFNSQEAFAGYARPEVGESVDTFIGYYNLQTNRMTTYDHPVVERKVATVVHEATHQLAYNSGLQTRLADNPFWVSEGLAVFFESPDLARRGGWRSIGRVNRVNLARFRDYVRRRPSDSLSRLLKDDRRFQDPATAADAYGEAWALNYFLLRTRPADYVAYLKKLAEGEPLEHSDPRRRLELFRETFGDLQELDRAFLRYMQRVR